LNLLISGNRKFPVVWSFAYKDDSRTRFEKNIRVQNRTLCKTAWKRERKKTKNQTRTRHKEPLRRWLTSRPVPFLSFRVRAKARALSPQDSASRSSSSPPSKQRIGRKRGYEGEASGKERLGSESGAYISAGTNCPIIHSVRRQRCSSAYPRPLLLPPRLRCRFLPPPPGVCVRVSLLPRKNISYDRYLLVNILSTCFNI